MTKKHFEAIAAAFAASRPYNNSHNVIVQWMTDLYTMAIVCHQANPAFKRDVFFSAAGTSTSEVLSYVDFDRVA